MTISKVSKKGFQIWVIPHTYNETNLSEIEDASPHKLIELTFKDLQKNLKC